MDAHWSKKLASKEAFFILLAYLKKNLIASLVITYLVIASILLALDIVDIGIPCPIRAVTGWECWGCGLTRATVCLLKLDFKGAWEMNKLIFIVGPAMSYYVITDFIGFVKKHNHGN